jgi:hypothetical protein
MAYMCVYIYAEESTPPVDLVVSVPGYRTEMYCVFCEVLTEFVYVR